MCLLNNLVITKPLNNSVTTKPLNHLVTTKRLLLVFTLLLLLCAVAGLLKYNDTTTIAVSLVAAAAAVVLAWLWPAAMREPTQPTTDTPARYTLYYVFPPFYILFIVVFVLQTVIVRHYPWQVYDICDFLRLREQAMAWGDGQTGLLPHLKDYYLAYPNNVNITAVCAAFYHLFGSWLAVILLFASMVNAAAALTGLAIRNITGSMRLGMAVAIAAEVYYLLSYDTYMPYTQNAGTLIVALAFYIYTRRRDWSSRVIWFAVALAVGVFVKITTIIPFIAIALVETVRMVRERRFVELGTMSLAPVLLLGMMFVFQSRIRGAVDYEVQPDRVHGFWYFAMLGQNNRTGGQYDEQTALQYGYIPGTASERNAAFRRVAAQSVAARGVVGNAKFYVAKTAICWGDTRLDALSLSRPLGLPAWVDHAVIVLRTALWLAMLALLPLAVLRSPRRRLICAVVVAVAGAVAFLCLSEACSRIAMMFSPVVFLAAGLAATKKV